MTPSQRDRAAHFRRLHTKRPLVLPNAWDAASARVIELAGAEAIATTSAAVSWVFGRGDGQTLRRDEMIQVIRSITRVVEVPVTADVEGGYGEGSAEDVAETVRGVLDAGAVGINLEDSPGHGGELLLAPEIQAKRIRAARAAGDDLVLNARTDVYLFQVGAPETRFAEAVRRANLYREAGADCVFVPGVLDAETIAALVRAIAGPVNIMAKPGSPTIAELGQLGVARVSLGPALALAALGTTQQAARELLEHGTYRALENGLPFGEANGMFART
ncbi:MAG TPA: 3-methyl-2-oxobutanoate hydroxymethyltransferase [Acidobacteria bacterium]|nr:3-methyl-2-oxobutanoate hydroxymethyltransferase [Acidobacteriota bacterium]